MVAVDRKVVFHPSGYVVECEKDKNSLRKHFRKDEINCKFNHLEKKAIENDYYNKKVVNYYLGLANNVKTPVLTDEIASFIMTELLHDVLNDMDAYLLKRMDGSGNIQSYHDPIEYPTLDYKKYSIFCKEGYMLLCEDSVELPLAAIMAEMKRYGTFTKGSRSPWELVNWILNNATMLDGDY